MLALELLLVLLLVGLNGLLAMSELAVVSARRSRLQSLAQAGSRGAAVALSLMQTPGRFLSTVQIGITLVGVLAGAFGGATIALKLAVGLQQAGLDSGTADTVAFVVVVAAITYLSLILGELVPKQIALRNAEGVAAAVARPMVTLSRLGAPAVWLLDLSSRLVLSLFGSKARPESTVTEEEIRSLIADAESAGVVEPEEKRMIAAVLRLGDRPVRALMTPRTDVDWVDLDDPDETILAAVRTSPHSRFPACRGGIDGVVGVLQTRDLLDAFLAGPLQEVSRYVREAPIVHDGADTLQVIEVLRKSPIHMAIVVDEYGTFEGIVSPADILGAIVGSFETGTTEESLVVQREDGSWLIDGSLPCDELADLIGIPMPASRDFHTVAGFVLAALRRLPKAGDKFETAGWRFEVVDMDGRRVDKVLASRLLVLHRR